MSPDRSAEPGPTAEVVRHFLVDRQNLVYLKFILEAYEGMATMSTVDRTGPIVRIAIPAGFTADIDELLAVLAREIPLTPTEFSQGEQLA